MEDFNRSLQPAEAGVAIVTANCYASQHTSYRPPSPESPIDPRLSPNSGHSPLDDQSSKKLRKTSRTQQSDHKHHDSLSSEPTLIHNNSYDSADVDATNIKESESETWCHSGESLTSKDANGITIWHSPDTSPSAPIIPTTGSRRGSVSPPSPKSTSPTCGRQGQSPPTTMDTQKHSDPSHHESDHHDIAADEFIETDSLRSVDYPGRLDADVEGGIIRTASGRETYLPDGWAREFRNGNAERNLERGSSVSSANGRRHAARDAGRAH